MLALKLRSWWSDHYKRPLKDPLLDSYTLEELIYEFHDYYDRKEKAAEDAKLNNAKIDDEKVDETLKWAEEEEQRETELAAQEAAMAKMDKTQNQEEAADLPEEINTNFSDI